MVEFQMVEQVNYFDYYPKDIPQCEETLALKELKLISKLNKIVNGPVEGNYCFIHKTVINEKSIPIKERSWKRQYLREAVKDSKYAIEIGFNAGHSAAIILCANKNVILTCIDICNNRYTVKTAKFMFKYFKKRFNFFGGSSQRLLKNRKLNKPIDFIHVDGGHGIADFYFDIDWSEKNLIRGGKLLIDDAYLPDYQKYLAYKIQQGVFKEVNTGRQSSGENILLEKL